MTRADHPSRRWLDLAMTAIIAGYVAAIAVVLWQELHLPVHWDENYYSRTFAAFRKDGWLAALREGYAVVYFAILQMAGANWSFVVAGRLVSMVAIVVLGVLLWRTSAHLGVSSFARRLSLAAFLNLVLAGHGWVFMAIADPVFTVSMWWVLIAIERAMANRRPGLAAIAGAGAALTWLIRPLAVLYTPAILCGIGLMILRDRQRGRAARIAALLVMTWAAGVLLQQAPSLLVHGRPAVEDKVSRQGSWMERRNLSRMRFGETAVTLKEWLWVPNVEWEEVRRYNRQHGEGSLPQSRIDYMRRFPGRKVREFAGSALVRVQVYLGGLLGLLYPLAWFARPRRNHEGESNRFMFVAVVVVMYILALNVASSPFVEWRWIMLPLVLLVCAGGLTLDRLMQSHPRAADAIVLVQIVFFCASLSFWLGRVLMARPA